MNEDLAINGGCLCGKIRYTITGPLCYANHCHCSMCRRQHGAAFSTYAGFDPENFKWHSGENNLKIFENPSGAGWAFCKLCGSTLAGTENGSITSITLGTFDGDPGVKPEAHIFVASKATWHDISDNLPQFDERPSNTKNQT